MQILNVAAYKFVAVSDREVLRPLIQEKCDQLGLKGTVLLADEGINFTLAAEEDALRAFLRYLAEEEIFQNRFSDLELKESFSERQPFGRMVVRMPKEIITMRHPTIRPEAGRAPAVEPKTLQKWLANGRDDDGREIVLLDTRNNYEVNIGTFENAVDFGIENFSQFPESIQNAIKDPQTRLSEKTIVTFCTGGIRCEKAALYMNELNLQHVYQLHGGILNYFETVGGEYWNGECFVFDERVAVDSQLHATQKDYGQQSAKIYRRPLNTTEPNSELNSDE